jgi:hypothetical protein
MAMFCLGSSATVRFASVINSVRSGRDLGSLWMSAWEGLKGSPVRPVEINTSLCEVEYGNYPQVEHPDTKGQVTGSRVESQRVPSLHGHWEMNEIIARSGSLRSTSLGAVFIARQLPSPPRVTQAGSIRNDRAGLIAVAVFGTGIRSPESSFSSM